MSCQSSLDCVITTKETKTKMEKENSLECPITNEIMVDPVIDREGMWLILISIIIKIKYYSSF